MSPGGRCESMELDNKILSLIERNTSDPRGVSLGATSSHRSPCSVKVRKTFCFFSIHPSAAWSLRRTHGESPWIISSKALPWWLRGQSEPVQTSLTQSLPVTTPDPQYPILLLCIRKWCGLLLFIKGRKVLLDPFRVTSQVWTLNWRRQINRQKAYIFYWIFTCTWGPSQENKDTI